MPRVRPILVPAVAALLAVAGCGGGDGGDDDAAVRAIVEEIAREPAAMCGHLSGALARELGGAEGCARVMPQGADPTLAVQVQEIAVDGDRATARYDAGAGSETLRFVREDGSWRLGG